MFREMVRQRKRICAEECHAVLREQKRGILSVNGDDGYPYAAPMNHYFDPEDGCLYFHCGKRKNSHRLDALAASDKVCYCVCEEGTPMPDDWALCVRSVVVFGRMEIVDDYARVVHICTALSRQFTKDESYIQEEIDRFAKGTLLLKLTPEHICGKRVVEK